MRERNQFIGFFLYVFEGDKNIADYLQDTLDMTQEFALEEFGIPMDTWQEIDKENETTT